MTSQQRKHHAARRVDDLITQRADSLNGFRNDFWKLMHVIRARTDILSPRRMVDNSVSVREVEQIVNACVRIACHRFSWKRSPFDWDVPASSPFVQLRSLVHHLFDDYPVPEFMTSVWWKAYPQQWEIDLYLYLAIGKGVRQFAKHSPLPLTRRMAALFMQAPDDLSPGAACRWSQVLALGGNERLARCLIDLPLLAEATSAEPFWETVIRFLIQYQPVSTVETAEIVKFIQDQRFEPAEQIWGCGAGSDPVQPDFSLRGRTLMSLRRHMANWRNDLIVKGYQPPVSLDPLDKPWQSCCIDAFRLEQDGIAWSIEELLTPRALKQEGARMQHCVAEYISYCKNRISSIWSMRMHQGELRKRILTIEVIPETKTIYQARGKLNRAPTESDMKILIRWAAQTGLKFRENI
ncbi:PcfJ domain-containing protein [Gimesia sp.]|uniref:PcfJ domain-containing protein n=1 Tax=Gimesia sp. TaxID=2024833 RepID=UPI003A8CF294